MNKNQAVEKAGSQAALAALCDVSTAAVAQWGEQLPQARVWQLKLLRPEWFEPESDPPPPTPTPEHDPAPSALDESAPAAA